LSLVHIPGPKFGPKLTALVRLRVPNKHVSGSAGRGKRDGVLAQEAEGLCHIGQKLAAHEPSGSTNISPSWT
jgi:hypothetical protein